MTGTRRTSAAYLPPVGDNRRNRRQNAGLAASLRGSAIGHVKVEVTDISTEGCRVMSPFQLNTGDNLVLVLTSLAPLGARVAWCGGGSIGLRFHQPLAVPVIDHVIGRRRPPS